MGVFNNYAKDKSPLHKIISDNFSIVKKILYKSRIS